MLLAIGDHFPELTLRDEDGNPRPLAELWRAGEALVLIGHGDCKTTRQTLPYINRLHRRAPGAAIVGVMQDEPEAARALRAELGLALPLWLESDPWPLAEALGLAVVPTLFVIGRDGRIAATSEAFRKADLEAFAARFGGATLFAADDPMPALRPG